MAHFICLALASARRTLSAVDICPTDADILMSHILSKDRCYLLAHGGDTVLTAVQTKRFNAQIEERCRGVPVAYLVGKRDFWDFTLQVNQHTLVPRPETEHLVESALDVGDAQTSLRVLDMGTGSGAIALALATERPHWQIVATDINRDTLSVARRNAARLHLEHVEFVQSDWFVAIAGRYDLIVSNPPYIAEDDQHMDVLRYEPRRALVSGSDGLQAIRQIIQQATAYLAPQGWLLFEHGADQGAACRALLAQHGLTDIVTKQDLAGLDRLSGGRWDREMQ